MKTVNFCFFAVSLVFAAQYVLAAENDINDDDEWVTISKADLCPALHKELICTEDTEIFKDVAKSIEDLGKEGIDDDQVDTGKKVSDCGDPLKTALCSKDARPLCLEDKTSGDDSAEKKVCKQLYDTCPAISDQKNLDYTEECVKYLKRKYSDMTCETVGAADFEDDEGCPRPVRKMPEFYIELYKTQSKLIAPLADLLDVANDLIDGVWDENCLKTVRELPCMPIYCLDDDDKTVQMRNKRNDCSKAMECVSKATQKLREVTLGETIADSIRDAVKDSCETIIEGFENIISDGDAQPAKGTGSTTEYSISFTLMAALFCFKMFLVV